MLPPLARPSASRICEPQEYVEFLRRLLWAVCNGDPEQSTGWAPIEDEPRVELDERPSIAHMVERSETQLTPTRNRRAGRGAR